MSRRQGDYACTGKFRFPSARVAKDVQRRRESGQKPGAVYRCLECGGWHIGRGKEFGAKPKPKPTELSGGEEDWMDAPEERDDMEKAL